MNRLFEPFFFCSNHITEVQEEYARHKEFLQRSILDLKRAVEADAMSHMTTNNAIRESNMKLIHEINTQREVNKNLKISVQADIGRIRHLAQSRATAANKRGKTLQQQTGGGGNLPYLPTPDGGNRLTGMYVF